MRPVVANLGFILQFAGVFTIFPILVAYFLNEAVTLIPLLITALTFLVSGFALNALSERKELDFKASCTLLTLTFLVLGLIGTIPSLYLRIFQGDIFTQFTNSYFESISGYTTTGLSLIEDIESLPKSLIVYRATQQFVGGIGIVFILLAFFYAEEKISNFAGVLGIEKVLSTIKRSFLSVTLVYLLLSVIFITIFYFIGIKDPVTLISTVFTTISTGGLPTLNNLQVLGFLPLILIAILMVLAAISFSTYINLFRLKGVITSEILTFLSILLFFSLIFYFFFDFDLFPSFFHTVSASTTTGHSFIEFKNLSENIKILFFILMFIGGCTLSTAGGTKVFRILLLFKSIPWILRYLLGYKEHSITVSGKKLAPKEIILTLITISLFFLFVFFSALHFSIFGFPFLDSIFEATSTISTVGYSTGITNVALHLNLKWNLILLMVFGRIEIIPFFVALFRERGVEERIEVISEAELKYKK